MNDSSRLPATFAIEAQKIRSYLLHVDHPIGGSKARFFIGWGFRLDAPTVFTMALLAHMRPAWLTKVAPFAWGTMFVFEGPIEAPVGTTPSIRSVWNVRPNTNVGLLSSAYPI